MAVLMVVLMAERKVVSKVLLTVEPKAGQSDERKVEKMALKKADNSAVSKVERMAEMMADKLVEMMVVCWAAQ